MKNINRSLSGILWEKFLDVVEDSDWRSLFLLLARFFCAIVISVSLVDVRAAGELFLEVFRWNGYAVAKISFAFFVVFGGGVYGRWILSLWDEISSLRPINRDISEDERFYGIPVVELVEYIFSGRGFVRSEVERRFGIPRNKFDEMAKKLDEVKIFSRGSNNARVLNPDMSREDVSSILFRAAETGEIRPLIRETENGFSHTPSMPALRSSSGFVTLPLSDFRVSAS